MVTLKLIVTGTLKESYLREAFEEYQKRLSAYCHTELIQLKESRIPEQPSESQIRNALDEEAVVIQNYLSPKAVKIALCVEGKELSSEALAEKIESWLQTSSEIDVVIGSAYGLSDIIKKKADFRLSISQMTFSHQMVRVLIMEILYRSFSIIHGSKYHK